MVWLVFGVFLGFIFACAFGGLYSSFKPDSRVARVYFWQYRRWHGRDPSPTLVIGMGALTGTLWLALGGLVVYATVTSP